MSNTSGRTINLGDSYRKVAAFYFVTIIRTSSQSGGRSDFFFISGSFVEIVNWWIKGHMQQTPDELDKYFCAVIQAIDIYPRQETIHQPINTAF